MSALTPGDQVSAWPVVGGAAAASVVGTSYLRAEVIGSAVMNVYLFWTLDTAVVGTAGDHWAGDFDLAREGAGCGSLGAHALNSADRRAGYFTSQPALAALALASHLLFAFGLLPDSIPYHADFSAFWFQASSRGTFWPPRTPALEIGGPHWRCHLDGTYVGTLFRLAHHLLNRDATNLACRCSIDSAGTWRPSLGCQFGTLPRRHLGRWRQDFWPRSMSLIGSSQAWIFAVVDIRGCTPETPQAVLAAS